jgi:hypothetical protein
LEIPYVPKLDEKDDLADVKVMVNAVVFFAVCQSSGNKAQLMYRLVKLLSELTLLHSRIMTLILSQSLLLLSYVPNLLLGVKLTCSPSLHHTLLLISYFRLLSSLASKSLDLEYVSNLSFTL